MQILIAEDEKEIAHSLKKSLIEAGHEPTIAHDGEKAIHLLNKHEFDLMLLDWRMPKISGLKAIKMLRADGNNIPIILITALNDISNKVEALNCGADDYITKPFSFEEVLARIMSVYRRYNSQRNKLFFDEFELDIASRTLTFPEGKLKLPEKEFELLKFFITNKNSIINKEVLAKEVWQLPFYPTTNYIEATVKNLRKKLEEISPKKFIKTVYGEGYIFVTD